MTISSESFDDHVLELVKLYLPVEKNNNSRLREMLKYSDWFEDKEKAAAFANMAKKEIITRLERGRTSGTFCQNDTVEVIEDLVWWGDAAAIRPKVGLVGQVLAQSVSKKDRYISARCLDEDYDYLIPTRFLSAEVGYPWREDDDPDRQYVTYNLPAYSIRKIEV